jgi:Flp pilus assembly protein TadD
LVNAGRFAEVFAALEGALRTDPKSIGANNSTGVALDLLGRYAEARPYFTARQSKPAVPHSQKPWPSEP